MDSIINRHSVRQYIDKPIEEEKVELLNTLIEECNREGDLHIQLILNEPKAFQSRMAKYGKFTNVKNYIALVGKKDKNLDEKCGYYGEKIVLKAQELGLNTCWVGLTYKKIPDTFIIDKDEKLVMVICIGYGETQGVSHKLKDIEELCVYTGTMPDWFKKGVEAAQLAPTALNQQKFKIVLTGHSVTIKPGRGFYTKVDAGIAKCHFEIGSGMKLL